MFIKYLFPSLYVCKAINQIRHLPLEDVFSQAHVMVLRYFQNSDIDSQQLN